MIDQIIDIIDTELNEPDIKNKINNKLIKPLMINILANTQQYFITLLSLYGIIIFIQLLILFILFNKIK